MNVQYNGRFDIALGSGRGSEEWKNKEITWSGFLDRLAQTKRTPETFQHYSQASRDERDRIKDVGAFFGGFLLQGNRKKKAVLHRQLLTLDVDFASAAFWETLEERFPCAAAIYTTHSHSPENPRFRLIIPLSRVITPEEHAPVSRAVAALLGIENFCRVSFRLNQLMHLPSTSIDGEYYSRFQDLPWLNPQTILDGFRDWRDMSSWPVSPDEKKLVDNTLKKQEDPTEKPGLIGAFCRCYSITDALEQFLSDEYEPTSDPGRWTYRAGSTSGGLVLYEDKWSYSHHGTDPTSERLCNAFDLVRLHKFGEKDAQAAEGTPVNKLPSFQCMSDFARSQGPVRVTLITERQAEFQENFEPVQEQQKSAGAPYPKEIITPAAAREEPAKMRSQSTDSAWMENLELGPKNRILSTIGNASLILENDSEIRGAFALDEFSQRYLALRELPWRRDKLDETNKFLQDSDDAGLRRWMEQKYQITSKDKINDAVALVTKENAFHPVRDYLNGLQWDGVPRIESLFAEYLGAEDSEYLRTVSRKSLVAAVARVFEPGIKYENMITFVGPEDMGKSLILHRLGGPWFSDSLFTIEGKEGMEALQGAWIIEMPDLLGLHKSEAEAIKGFLSKQEDRMRPAYGRRMEYLPRQNTFWGTTNKWDFLKSMHGNRRFWPVVCREEFQKKNPFYLTPEEIGQIWAEALEMYKAGEELILSKELREIAKNIQKQHTEQDERAGLIGEYLEVLLPKDWATMGIYQRREYLRGDGLGQEKGEAERYRVCAAEIYCEVFGGNVKDMTSHNTRFIHDYLRGFPGWQQGKSRTIFSQYGNQIPYYRRNTVTTVGILGNTTDTTDNTTEKKP